MKNSNTYTFIKVGILSVALFGFSYTAHATGTWTEAPSGASTAPTGNVDAPINVGTTGQVKAGSLAVGETAMSSAGTTAGLDLEVGGAAAVTGFANWGKSALAGHVDIGVRPTKYLNVGSFTAASTAAATSLSAASSSGRASFPTFWIPQHFAMNSSDSFFSRVVGSLRATFAGLINTESANAAQVSGVGCTNDNPDCWDAATSTQGKCIVQNGYGDCWWPAGSGQCGATKACPSDQVCTDPTDPRNQGTCYTPTPPIDSLGVGADITAARVSTPVIKMTAAQSSINTGASDSIVWSVSGAASCVVASTTTDSGNSWTALSPALNSSGSASGTKYFSSFTNYGTNFYTITCEPIGIGFEATQTISITVGPTYILSVYGNASYDGYIDVTGNLNVGHKITSNGKSVCLADGTNCPPDTAMVLPDVSDDGAGLVTIKTMAMVKDATTPQLALAHTSTSTGWVGVSGADMVLAKEGSHDFIFKTDSTYPTGITTGTEVFRIKDDQSGALELGSSSSSGTTPYFDFHYGNGTSQDFNIRMINRADSVLSFENSSGSTPLEINSDATLVKNLHIGPGTGNGKAIYTGCSGSDHLLYKDNAYGGGCSVFGYVAAY